MTNIPSDIDDARIKNWHTLYGEEDMTDELREAIEWGRNQIGYGGHEWRRLRALIDAAERSVPTVADKDVARAIDLARKWRKAYGFGELSEILDTLVGAVLSNAAAEPEHPTITPEMVAPLLPDWAAGMVWWRDHWFACAAAPRMSYDGKGWDRKADKRVEKIYLELPAPADWKTSWTPKPKPELRCPDCGKSASIDAYNGRYAWCCDDELCGARGGFKATEAEARAGVEERHGSDVS